jgi:hypothetical protein
MKTRVFYEQLMSDEYMEHKKRVQTLDTKIQDLRKKHGLLPGNNITLHVFNLLWCTGK